MVEDGDAVGYSRNTASGNKQESATSTPASSASQDSRSELSHTKNTSRLEQDDQAAKRECMQYHEEEELGTNFDNQICCSGKSPKPQYVVFLCLLLIRALTHKVARRAIVADDKYAPAAFAQCPSAADGRSVLPHDLRVVSAYLAVGAGVVFVVVVLLLLDPEVDGVGQGEGAAAAPEDVLPVRPAGVHELAIGDALVGVLLSVGGDVVVP
ncbi:unnamed protein product [Musa banksii]